MPRAAVQHRRTDGPRRGGAGATYRDYRDGADQRSGHPTAARTGSTAAGKIDRDRDRVFFASDDAKLCTGQTLVVDGGLAMPA
jgi:hypothetical protein